MKLHPHKNRPSILAAAAFALLAGLAPSGTAAQTGDTFATTRDYLTQFYPLWFTYNQSRISSKNRLIGPDRISPLYQAVVAINDDTLYASTVMDLTVQPVVLSIPSTPTTYSILTLDQYGEVLHSNIPPQMPGQYLITGPGYGGVVPPGVTHVEMPTERFIFIFRIDKYSNSSVPQLTEAQRFRRELEMQPLCAFLGDPCPDNIPPGGSTLIVPEIAYAIPFKTVADKMIAETPIEFLRQLQDAVASPQTPPLSPSEQALSEHFDALFRDGDWDPSSDFGEGARSAHRDIVESYLTNLGSTNWIHFTDIGNWGGNALHRSAITEFIQYGNDISAAAYYHTFKDASGQPLVGSSPHGYILHFPPGTLPDAQRFWSLTAYTPNAIELIGNPANKFVVARYTPHLHYGNDGSLTIYIAKEQPPGVPKANWLPVSDRPFNVMLRVYGVVPGSSVDKDTYTPPAIVELP